MFVKTALIVPTVRRLLNNAADIFRHIFYSRLPRRTLVLGHFSTANTRTACGRQDLPTAKIGGPPRRFEPSPCGKITVAHSTRIWRNWRTMGNTPKKTVAAGPLSSAGNGNVRPVRLGRRRVAGHVLAQETLPTCPVTATSGSPALARGPPCKATTGTCSSRGAPFGSRPQYSGSCMGRAVAHQRGSPAT